jgi:HK97 family phage major capsid protein
LQAQLPSGRIVSAAQFKQIYGVDLTPESYRRVTGSKLPGESPDKPAKIEHKAAASKAHFDDLNQWLSEVSGGADDDWLSAKSLARRGFDVQFGMLEFRGQAIYPAGVVAAPRDEDTLDLRKLRAEASVTLRPEYGTAWMCWLREYRHYGKDAILVIGRAEGKALSEGSDGSGGYAVPPEFAASIAAQRAANAVVRPLATVLPCGSDQLVVPMAQPATDADTYRSNLLASWHGETPAWTSSDPSFQQVVIPVRKLRIPLTVSNDLWADAPALAAHIAATGGANLAAAEDIGIITGAGTPLVPLGIINSGAESIDLNAPDAAGVRAVVKELPAQYRRAARWIMSTGLDDQIRALTADATVAVPLYPRDGTGGTIEGYPVELSPALNDDTAIFGDLSSVFIADRMTLSLQLMRERFADTDQTGILLKSRVGSAVVLLNGLKIGATS